MGGGFAYRADILAWPRRPVRTFNFSVTTPSLHAGLQLLIGSSLCTWGIAYPTLYHIVLFHRLPVIHARLACSLPYTLAMRLTLDNIKLASYITCGSSVPPDENPVRALFYKFYTFVILHCRGCFAVGGRL